MQKTNLSNPNERKKLIIAAILGVIAIVVLWWTFIGFGSSSTAPPPQKAAASLPPAPGLRTASNSTKPQNSEEGTGELLAQLEPISYLQTATNAAEPKRNIFAYYEPPKPTQTAQTPTPTPEPTPPIMLTTVAPSNVYARTADFNLDVTGDKFSPELRIVVDNKELPTKYHNAQQLSAIVPAALIANPGQRQVIVRSADGRLYSNASAFSVTPPPTPNYNYIGIIGDKHYVDIALLQDRSNKELLNVQRGDVLSGRFRVTSISEKEVVLTDTTLKIKHSLAMNTDGDKGLGPLARPTPKVVDAEDDEP